uniref:Protein kinase domain-containing protein n=1 Tax=Meloidogyne javanica TaxID=6303 RepID=A0A915N7W3_MELJA
MRSINSFLQSKQYTVVESISSGCYGVVYKIKQKGVDGAHFALNEERQKPQKEGFKLEMEIRVLEAAKGVPNENKKHFPILYDRSVENPSLMFIVMTLLGETSDVGDVGEMKEAAFADPTRLFPGPELSRLRTAMEYINGKKYKDQLDYDYLAEMVRRLGKKRRCSLAAPFDWS